MHLRLWTAERLADLLGVGNLSSAPWITYYAKALGARIGPGVDLHSLPPVTGMLKLGKGAAVEPEVDLAGWWLDGDTVHVGKIRIGAGARIGSRSTLVPRRADRQARGDRRRFRRGRRRASRSALGRFARGRSSARRTRRSTAARRVPVAGC